MDSDAAHARHLAIGLARYLVENSQDRLDADTLAACIYRLRIVDNYTSADVDLVCDAMRILTHKLVQLPPISFAPEVWMTIMMAVAEGGIEPHWTAMVDSIDLTTLAIPYVRYDSPITTAATSTKCSEQIATICEEHALDLGLTRRVFAAIWETDFDELTLHMANGQWDLVKVKTSEESANQARGLFERNVFDQFTKMDNHEKFARELYYASLARMMRKFEEENPNPTQDEEDVSFYESNFLIYDEVIKKMWTYMFKDKEVLQNTLKIFEKLLAQAPTKVLIQKVAERFTDAVSWLKITEADICKAMEPTLWNVIDAHVKRIIELKKTIPYEIGRFTDWSEEFELEQVPTTGNKKERFLRSMVGATCKTLNLFLSYLSCAASDKDVVTCMTVYYPELFASLEITICNSMITLYKSATTREIISADSQVDVARVIVGTAAIKNVLAILACSEDPDVCKRIVELILLKIPADLEDEDAKRETYVKHLIEVDHFWRIMGKNTDKQTIVRMARMLVYTAASEAEFAATVLATDLLLTILKLPLNPPQFMCNFDFKDLEIEPVEWDKVGSRLVEVNIMKRSIENMLPLFTIAQLTSTDLSMRELIYVITQLKILRTVDGMELHKAFYGRTPNMKQALKTFITKDYLTDLCCKFLDEFSAVISSNSVSLIFSLDHENLLEWLKDIGVRDEPKITNKLVEMCRAIEEWDALMLLQLENAECDSEDVRTFSRFWKTDSMTAISAVDQKIIEEDIVEMLKVPFEAQDALATATRQKRSKGNFPNRPLIEDWERQLQTMHHRIAMHLVSKRIEDFEDEQSEMYEWLVGVCSGQASYRREITIDAKKILARIQPDSEKRNEILYNYGVSQILLGISNAHEQGTFSMRTMFLKIYIRIVESDMKTWKETQTVEELDRRMGGFLAWIQNTSNNDDAGLHLSCVVLLADNMWKGKKELMERNDDKDPMNLAYRKFLEVLCTKIDFLADWTAPSKRPYHAISELRPLFSLIRSFPDIETAHQEVIDRFFTRIFEQLFDAEHRNIVIGDVKFAVQHTDKYLSSSLNVKRDYELPPPKESKNKYYVREVLELLSTFGSANFQKTCLQRIATAFETLPGDILKHVDVLNGSRRIENVEEKELVCDVTLLTECLGYTSRLFWELSNIEPTEDVLRAFMLLDPDVHSKMEKSQSNQQQKQRADQIDLNFCTYKSTGNNFVNQHWYNCYTCKMMESTGVCSTCAVNCHRGHDLAYSKKGAFFCDCGSAKCDAMERITHYPNAMDALRGQFPDSNVKTTAPKTREVFAYSFGHLDVEKDGDVLREGLRKVCEKYSEKKQEILKILKAVEEANERALTVSEKRLKIRDSFFDQDIQIVKEDFMRPLQPGHFLPTRRVEQEQNSKLRNLADVVKLDNGTELLVMIPESMQTSLQLHYMDTRTNLLQGMFSLRTETEPIPFNARQLHVSGNRLVVCGLHEIYALRFSPQGTVIDRAHIKLAGAENGGNSSVSNNPVVKAKFCTDRNNKKQLVALATVQYLRIYDLTLSDTNFVEELVLTAGNVADFVVLPQEDNEIRVLIVSSTGFLYEHIITDCTADNNSIFLTCVANLPGDTMEAFSLHYSETFDLVFASFNTGTFYAWVPPMNANLLRGGETTNFEWKKLDNVGPTDTWHEAAGILTCLSRATAESITFIHPMEGRIITQTEIVKRPIMTYFTMASSKNQSVYSVLIFPDLPTCEIWETNWNDVHDLWIDDVPSERYAVEMVENKTAPLPLEKEDLVLMAEQCEPLATIDWTSRDIEQFYTHTDLNNRLSVNESLPLTIVQQTHFTLSARITNSRQIVRMIRVEVEGVNGPDALKIGNVRHSINCRGPKTFDLRLTRDESILLDHRNITIEVIPKAAQNLVKIKNLKLFGCDRSAMDEFQPVFERKPVLTLPNKLVYSIVEFSMLQLDDNEWTEGVAKKLLSRKMNHPIVAGISTRALAKCHPMNAKLFEIVDESYLREWKALAAWTEDVGMSELRKSYVEQLLERMEAVRTRWPLFEKTVKKEFGSVVGFVELMREEMCKMPLHRCQLMAQAIVKLVFGFLAHENPESEQLMQCFLDIFTDNKTYQLANDMRSAVQETISRFEHAVKEERAILERADVKEYGRLKSSEFAAFYDSPRILKRTPENLAILKLIGETEIDGVAETKWLEQFIAKILEKLKEDRALKPTAWMTISDSPSYNLSRVIASCLSICSPEVIKSHFNMLIKLIKYSPDKMYPLNEESFSNYALLRSLELLVSVCLEKRAEERDADSKPYSEMLDQIVQELHNIGIRDFCFNILEVVIPHWKERGPSTFSRNSGDGRRVWLPHVPLVSSSANPPNAAMLNWPANSDDAYIIACTDLVLLIPQHLQEVERRRISPQDDRWIQKLCLLASLSTGCSAYRQCKKMILGMCHGDEAMYKTIRDKYKMQDLLQQLVQKYMLVSREVGGHQQLTELVDVLGSISKLALNRADMWRDVCVAYTDWLLRLACYTTDVVASQVVELLIVAVRDSSHIGIQLADSIIEANNGVFIEKIITRFLIGRDEPLRWTIHGMLRSIIQLASRQNQCILVKKLYYVVYPMTKHLGVQGAQIVDLLCVYATRVFSSTELVAMCQTEIAKIQELGTKLDTEGFHGSYRLMTELGLGWKSIQFDRNPCLTCFSTKGSHEMVKVSSIRSDTRYSANTIIYKLISNYEISKVMIKLTDIKKSKSIKKVSLYYSAKSVESVDLKLHPELWRKCAVVSVGDTETVITLSLVVPVVTSSLIIEFGEVLDARAPSDTHCPRCSGPIRPQSGVCETCGENAFQCMKCRSINYVDREPFLCQSCGFCKYARIEISAVCRALPGAQHITSDVERGQCVQEITQLLIKMETTKTKLSGYRAVCESLYLRNRPLATYKLHVENNHTSEFFEANGTMSVDQHSFQSITLPMNALASAIRVLHAELCQQTQQLMYLHEELNRYDHASEVSVVFHKPQNVAYYSTSETCFGCVCHQLLHSIALVSAGTDDENAFDAILTSDGFVSRLGSLSHTYETLREECEELLVRLMFARTDVTSNIENLIQTGQINLSVIVKSLMTPADPTWQQKLKILIRHAIEKPDENTSLQALMVLNRFLDMAKSVPSDERKKIKITPKSHVIQWLTSEVEWTDCCSVASTSTAPATPIPSNTYQWISTCLFSQWMNVRSAANQLLVNLSRQHFHEPVALLMLCENLSQLSDLPSSVCDQFMSSAHTIMDSSVNTKARLFVQQFHVYLIKRIHEECVNQHTQKVSLLSDNTFGERLRCFVELLSLLLSGSSIENVLLKAGADDLLIFLLHSTIFLKRMMTRRTRAIDSSRIALEKLLRRVSCRDGSKLMSVCVESLKIVKDASTLGIIVGVMMEIMNPQQETEESFLIQIEKDPAQEDFLQGRMIHNPYNSTDSGMGPLMRDIKNKICRDTEMIALMDDDNGMELLIGGNIISLSLSVRDVYERLWRRNNNGSPMLMIYRMRGLMGDAVETFIENFGVAEGVQESEEDEQLVRMSHCLMQCGGLDKLMNLLTINIDSSSGRFMLAQLRKIFDRIVKTSAGRKALVERRMVEKMFSVIRTCCADATNESKVQIGMELYKVVEFVVSDKNVHPMLSGILEMDASWWFGLFEKRGSEEGSTTELHRKTAQILDQMTANIGNIVLGSDDSERVFVEMFPKILKWKAMDSDPDHSASRNRLSERDRTILMTEQLATIVSNILQSDKGVQLKQKILDSGVIAMTCQYLMKDLPNLYQATESAEWKQFLTRPSLKLILTMLAGLARGHQASQKEIAKTTLKLMHRLEQVASDNSIGTLAENVIEALNEDEEVRNQITQVREETKKKKKELAMKNRNAQLNKLGMHVGSSGEVKVSARNLHNEPSLDETDSLVCCICRESVIRGERAAGVYAFAAVDPDTGKTGSVSMMVMVHHECHKSAIRGGGGGRAADEWSRAKLHNAGAKCNVITPIAVAVASEQAWREAIHRFETDVGRISGLAHGHVNRNFVFVDMCKLIDRFIYKRSFSSQSEGGGRESNMQYLAILHLLGCSLSVDADPELETLAPNHRLLAYLFTEPTADGWNEQKNDVLRAGLNDAQTSGVAATWDGFKPTLLTWAFVDMYFNKVIPITGTDRPEWLREHLGDTITKTAAFVNDFDDNVLPCEDAAEFCDVTGAPLDEVNMFLAPPANQ